MTAEYIHGTSPDEQSRLNNLNRLTNAPFIDYLRIRGDERICDFGCGLGEVDAQIAEAFPSVEVVGIERSEEQFAVASRRNRDNPRVRIVLGDVNENGLEDATFDLTFCRYLLEHVKSPEHVAREMVRVTKPGGRVAAQENDLHNVLYYPEIEGHAHVFKRFCEMQLQMGGDPFIGRKLFSLFDQEEVERVELEFSPEIYTSREPERYRAWVSNSFRILQGAGGELTRRGLVTAEELGAVLSQMEGRIRRPVGVALFYWNRVTAYKRA